ncbi:hypothetical protein EDWATA_02084 [Edwardsiella tarda ATCC 23685]|uniref:Uncharacterized protein n=1 Tax=Edwardsiella tarda ATCC 23685 TaxID=500638 RepID=D4F5Q6_EDWTA|nr:hypothetical protein EDWATA_02084 [Edwardsiella tarda ATCC 23685]
MAGQSAGDCIVIVSVYVKMAEPWLNRRSSYRTAQSSDRYDDILVINRWVKKLENGNYVAAFCERRICLQLA